MSADPFVPLPEASRRWRPKTPSMLGRDDLHNSSASGSPRRIEKKGFAKYLSSYLSAATTPTSPKTGSPQEDFWTKIDRHEYFDTTASLDTIDCLFKRLINEPYRPLDASANSSLLRIFEAYRKLSEENVRLESRFDEALQTSEVAGKMWTKESNEYQTEIKRLNIPGAKENRGLMGRIVTRKDFQQRKRSVDVTSPVSDQGTFSSISSEGSTGPARPCPDHFKNASPSRHLTELSRQLSVMGHFPEFPLGRPGEQSALPPLSYYSESAKAGKLSDFSLSDTSEASEGDRDLDATSLGAFSSVGDPLPDEVDDPATVFDATDSDLLQIRGLAAVIARRRGLPFGQILPKLLDLFSDLSTSGDVSSRLDTDDIMASGGTLRAKGRRATANAIAQQTTSKMSSYAGDRDAAAEHERDHIEDARQRAHNISRRMSLAEIPTSLNQKSPSHLPTVYDMDESRFSFRPGDDGHWQDYRRWSSHLKLSPYKLRKSMSLSDMNIRESGSPLGVQSSSASRSTTSPMLGRSPSQSPRILPSPRPSLLRVQRDTSTSSLVTVVPYEEIAERDGPRPGLQRGLATALQRISVQNNKIPSESSSLSSARTSILVEGGDRYETTRSVAVLAAARAVSLCNSEPANTRSQRNSGHDSDSPKTGQQTPSQNGTYNKLPIPASSAKTSTTTPTRL